MAEIVGNQATTFGIFCVPAAYKTRGCLHVVLFFLTNNSFVSRTLSPLPFVLLDNLRLLDMIRSSLFATVALAATVVSAGKRGLAWPWFNEANSALDPSIFGDGCGEVSSIYNWETWAPSKTGDLNFIGTQRCTDCESSPIQALATRAKEQGWTDVFTLNEPDLSGVTPTEAALWWKEHINGLENINRFTPAISNSGAEGQGIRWLQQFFEACAQECSHEGINIHWYGDNFIHFKDYIEEVEETFPGEYITISEFALAGAPSAAEQLAFFTEAFPFLDADEHIDTYFPFVATTPALIKQYHGADGYTGNTLLADDSKLSAIGSLLTTPVPETV